NPVLDLEVLLAVQDDLALLASDDPAQRRCGLVSLVQNEVWVAEQADLGLLAKRDGGLLALAELALDGLLGCFHVGHCFSPTLMYCSLMSWNRGAPRSPLFTRCASISSSAIAHFSG